MTLYASYQFPALRLMLDGSHRYTVVRTICDAAAVLVNEWPTDEGDEYICALVACLSSYHEKVHPSVVRDALIRAADEGNIRHISLVTHWASQTHRSRA
jgi:hypothetical protein